MVEISASILSVEKDKMQTFYNLEASKIDYFHIDVMDGKFVKNNTKDIMLENATRIKEISNLPMDVHLMVEDIDEYIEEYSLLYPYIITFHIEAVKEKNQVMEIINKLKEKGIKVGIAVKPNTKLDEIYEYLKYIHMVLIMTVEPGYGGQELIQETVEKVKKVKEYIENNKLDTYIQVDGGINEQTSDLVKQAGAEILVVGKALVNSENYTEVVKEIKK